MTVTGYEDVTSSGVEFSLARGATASDSGHNTDGEHSVNLHRTLYESTNNMLASKTSQTFVLVPEFTSGALFTAFLKAPIIQR